ncbi:MAG: hypothetical protein AAB544_06135 [Patescibacteria group bacterium]
MKPYGPSNWEEIPEQTRSHIHRRESAPGKNDGEKELAIWTARDLFREQTRAALELGEQSPDALWEIATYISDHANTHQEDEANNLNGYLVQHQELIHSGILSFNKIPRNQIIKYGRHPRLLGVSSQFYAQKLEDYIASDRTPRQKLNSQEYGDEIDTIKWILYAVAMYEDAMGRGTDSNQNFGGDEPNGTPPQGPNTGSGSLVRQL